MKGKALPLKVLNNLGIEGDRVRHAVEAIIGRGGRLVAGEVGMTPRAKKVIELALDEAGRLNQHVIGTEHLLVGLLREGEGIAARVLENLGLQLEQVRTETRRVLRQQQQGQEEAPAIPPVPSEARPLLTEDEPGLTCTSWGHKALATSVLASTVVSRCSMTKSQAVARRDKAEV